MAQIIYDENGNDEVVEVIESPIEELLQKKFFTNKLNDTIINGIGPRLILSEKENAELAAEFEAIMMRKMLGEEPTIIEKMLYSLITEGTY